MKDLPHVGAISLKFPLNWQVTIVSPDNVKPESQLKLRVSPTENDESSDERLPLTGGSRVSHRLATEIRGNVFYCYLHA